MAVTVAIIGAGSMGSSLLKGMLSTDALSNENVRATTHSHASAQKLAQELGIRAIAAEDNANANAEAVQGADFVFLGVKPWSIRETAQSFADAVSEDTVIVSMAAGVSLKTLAAAFPNNPVVRIMPNTPSAIGKGVITVSPDDKAPEVQVEELTKLLSGAGEVFTVPESAIGGMIGISGSGVAYFFLLAEKLITAGQELGLDEDTARRMAVATAEGAGLLLAGDPDPAKLRAAVAHPGGTTAAAVDSFEADGFEASVVRAARAAAEKAADMERENR